MSHHDIIIIGAGIWGISAAHTFLTINPALNLLIVDSKVTIGGVWAKEQLYPGLKANNLQGYYEFTDFSMLEAGLEIEERGILTGEAIHAYLVKSAEKFGLVERIRLQTEAVRAVERKDGQGWVLDVRRVDSDESVMESVTCKKLVVATGQASIPFRPSLKGESLFNAPVVHSADFSKNVQALLHNDAVKNITVLGGSKSAHDAVYLFATAKKNVKWIIHPATKGRGAVPLVVPYMHFGPWNLWLEPLFLLRPLTWFLPAPWSDGDGFGWIRWFLHSTRLGNRLVKWVFNDLGSRAAADSGIIKDSSTKDLAPGAPLHWYGTQSNVLMYDTDFYDIIRNGEASITLGHVDHLEDGLVCLDDGTNIASDVLILSTGYNWSVAVPLEPASKRLGWGCPVDPSEDTIYPKLDIESDKKILSRYTMLNESPRKTERLPSKTRWRLWRSLAPPSQVESGSNRNLVFLNTISSYQSFLRSEITSLWAYAYLYDRLVLRTPSEKEAQKEVSLWTRFGKWRTPYGSQGKWTDFLLDSMPYYDLLLRDLRLRSWRRGWGWFGEVFGGPYETKDYKAIVQEWIATQPDLVDEDKKRQ